MNQGGEIKYFLKSLQRITFLYRLIRDSTKAKLLTELSYSVGNSHANESYNPEKLDTKIEDVG